MRQVLLVTGGASDKDGRHNLDSTEVLEDIAGTWRLTASLPSARWELRAAVLVNKILVFGANILCYLIYNVYIMTIYLQEDMMDLI